MTFFSFFPIVNFFFLLYRTTFFVFSIRNIGEEYICLNAILKNKSFTSPHSGTFTIIRPRTASPVRTPPRQMKATSTKTCLIIETHHIIIITAIYNNVVKKTKNDYWLFRSALIATEAVRDVGDGVDIQKYIYINIIGWQQGTGRGRRSLSPILSVNVGTF